MLTVSPLPKLALATARSGRPSPLKSPTATDHGPVPVAKVVWGEKGHRPPPLDELLDEAPEEPLEELVLVAAAVPRELPLALRRLLLPLLLAPPRSSATVLLAPPQAERAEARSNDVARAAAPTSTALRSHREF
jgi:hypothetical protein